MATNPLNMKPTELIRLMNRAGHGTILNESRLKTHRLNDINTADGKGVDLLKYAAWLTLEYFTEDDGSDKYLQRRIRETKRNADAVRAAQDIGELPEVVETQRKKAGLHSFQKFCETYFSEVFYLPWSDDHLRVIKKIERAVRRGGLFAMAMPRGSGKALALDTPIATFKNGDIHWKTMGTLEVGDYVCDSEGSPTRVDYATEVMHDHPCFEVTFSDGEKIVCDADHLWKVHNGAVWITITTAWLKAGFRLPATYRGEKRLVESIVPVPSVPVRCIQVDAPDQLYWAGKKCVPTHNTVLCQTAVVWAALSGATPFVCLIAASAERGKDLLENIKTWLETNPLLQQDFPEVCFPIQCLERISNRQKGQKYFGEPTRIEWGADRIILPTIKGSKASGVVISCSGMKGSDIRGQNYARPDGKVVRPRLVLIDDPQTTESAWSPSQSLRREAILAGDVLGMAGPGKKIAGLMACTVIRPEDMADNILSREKHPEWQGERTKMVYSFPNNEKLWSKYADLRRDSLRNDGDGSVATEFYVEHRDEMDAGARIAWPDRYNPDEISAIQHAMNLKFRDEAAFMAEYQNEPVVEKVGEEMLSADDIAAKTNGYPKGLVPLDCHHLTMFIDVHQSVLYWMVMAWDRNFSGFIIDYGTWPDQKRPYFLMRDAHRTLQLAHPGGGVEGSIYAGLEALCEERFSHPYYREDGMVMYVNRGLIDAGWGQTTDVIYQFCRQSKHGPHLFPSHGKYVGASGVPFSEYRQQRGDRVGLHWRIPNLSGKRQVRHVLIDTNYWKSFVYSRFAVLMGDPGCISLYGHDAKAHQLLSEHLTGEYRIKTLANGRTVDEWKVRSTRPDNHWFDCLVGTAVAASIEGVELSTLKTRQAPKRTRIKFSDRQRNSF